MEHYLSPQAEERLKLAHDFLARQGPRFDSLPKIPDAEFDLRGWSCETTACAVGHMAHHAYFNELGLRLTDNGGITYIDQHSKAQWYGFDAVSKFFDIPTWLVLYLFTSEGYKTLSKTKVKKVRNRLADLLRSI